MLILRRLVPSAPQEKGNSSGSKLKNQGIFLCLISFSGLWVGPSAAPIPPDLETRQQIAHAFSAFVFPVTPKIFIFARRPEKLRKQKNN